MRKITTLLSLFAAMAIGSAMAGSASADERDGYRGGRPDGGYQETCRDIRVDKDRLTARCRTNSGYYNYTALSLRDCRGGQVENHNGNLVCIGGGYGNGRPDFGFGGGLPEGGYRDTCRDIDVDRGVLTAYCRTKNGSWNFTSLDLRDCRGGVIENKRGVLVCRGR